MNNILGLTDLKQSKQDRLENWKLLLQLRKDKDYFTGKTAKKYKRAYYSFLKDYIGVA